MIIFLWGFVIFITMIIISMMHSQIDDKLAMYSIIGYIMLFISVFFFATYIFNKVF